MRSNGIRSLQRAVFLALATSVWAGAASATVAVEENIYACTNGRAAWTLMQALTASDQNVIDQFIAGGECSFFASAEYATIAVFYRRKGNSRYNIMHVKMYHLIDMFVLTMRDY